MKLYSHRIARCASLAVLSITACAEPSPGDRATTETAAVGNGATDSVPTLNLAKSGSWVVSIRGIQGDCAPDASSCDQRFEARSDGSWSSELQPHPLARDGRAVTTRKVMADADFAALRELVTSKSFEDEMRDGFACQGGKKDPDYTWRITFKTDSSERVQHAEYCISGPPDAVNSPGKLLQLLEKK